MSSTTLPLFWPFVKLFPISAWLSLAMTINASKENRKAIPLVAKDPFFSKSSLFHRRTILSDTSDFVTLF